VVRPLQRRRKDQAQGRGMLSFSFPSFCPSPPP
jgi:hypothetical protein